MNVIQHKIWHDFWQNKGRTLRVVLIIAVGAFAIGFVIGAREHISNDVTRNWQRANPATIGITVDPAITDEQLQTLENMREVDTVAGWMRQTVQWRPAPNQPWEPAILMALDDYEEQEIRKVLLDSGTWPQRKMMGVQRGRELTLGETVYLEIEETEHQVELNSVLYDVATPPAMIAPEPVFFTTRERFTQLTGETNYSLVLATMPHYTPAKNQQTADLIQNELEKQNVQISPAIPKPGGFFSRTNHPDRFIAQDALDGVFLILTTMAGLTLLLGLFLVYNTINAIILQQVNQIGVMKAIGASFYQILQIYALMVIGYAVSALLLAVPLGAIGAQGLRVMLVGGRIGMEPGPFTISQAAVLAQTVVALFSPLLIAIVPIFSGASITVREAISSYGLSSGASLLDRMLVRFDALPRLVTLTISNTFRNKKRVLLTQITLVGSGIIFMMVMNTRLTIVHTFSEVIFSIFEANVMLDLKEAERIEKIEALTNSLPEVKQVEVWGIAKASARLRGMPESNDDSIVTLRGVPVPSVVYQPQLRAGRWLTPNDEYAVVLNQAQAEEIGVGVGDWLTFDIPTKREANWQVVGLVFEPLDQDTALMPRHVLLRETRQVGQGTVVKVQTHQQDAATEARVAAQLRKLYEAQGYEVIASTMDTAHRTTEQKVTQMEILLILLSIMAIMIAVVGAIALSGTLAINVLERVREIGVMRAIGASAFTISGQFVGEGLLLSWLSWVLAIPLGLPAGLLLVNTISAILNIELAYQISVWGVLYWLGIITVLAMVASWFPAQKAAQTSVRDSLAYA